MPLPRIDNILAADSDLQPLVAKAREIRALAKHCNEFFPPELARQLRPANFQGGKLVVLAANAAAAAKLKLLSEPLSDFLLKRGAKVNAVLVKVQLAELDNTRSRSPRSARISPATIVVLSKLYETLGDSPARQALERLLAGAKAGVRSPAVDSGMRGRRAHPPPARR